MTDKNYIILFTLLHSKDAACAYIITQTQTDLICLCYSITNIIRVSFIRRNQRRRVPQFLCPFHCCLDSTEEGAPQTTPFQCMDTMDGGPSWRAYCVLQLHYIAHRTRRQGHWVVTCRARASCNAVSTSDPYSGSSHTETHAFHTNPH